MSITVEFRLIDKGRVVNTQVSEYDTLDEAAMDQYDGMGVGEASNPGARWVDMRVVSSHANT